jgi:hypothetical protein
MGRQAARRVDSICRPPDAAAGAEGEDGKSGGGNSYGYYVVKSFDAKGELVRGSRTINQAEAEVSSGTGTVIWLVFWRSPTKKPHRRVPMGLRKLIGVASEMRQQPTFEVTRHRTSAFPVRSIRLATPILPYSTNSGGNCSPP